MTTRTVTGTYLNIDGSPVKGYLEFTPSSTLALDAVIPVSVKRVVLDATGSFTCELQVTDDPLMIPQGWKWSVEEKIPNGNQWYLDVPTSVSPLDISDAYIVGDNGGPFYAVQGATGPVGPPGPLAVSTDAGNLAFIGTDNKVYVPNNQGGYDEVVVSNDAPTDPSTELWIDRDASPVPAMKFKDPVDDQWKSVGGADEVVIQTAAPVSAGLKLWVDTDAPGDTPLDIVPLGTIVMYGGTAAPTGWKLCDGTAHGSASLLALLGSANVPDLRGKFIVGVGDSPDANSPTVYAQNDEGGLETVTLTADQSGTTAHTHGTSVATASANAAHSHGTATASGNAAHSHGTATVAAAANHSHTAGTGNDTPDHAHAVSGYTPNPGTGANYYVATMGTDVYGSYSSAGANARHTHSVTVYAGDASHAHTINADNAAHAHTINSDNAAHSHTFTPSTSTAAAAVSAHENRPPYYALTYIIKVI